MDISAMVDEVHETAVSKGWYEDKRSPLEAHMLMVSELAEATEEARLGHAPVYCHKGEVRVENIAEFSDTDKPEGEAVELVDAIIRIADYFGYKGWDLAQVLRLKMDYNKTRPHRHGGKKY